jgi:glycosyltransferase involved in cell wall biosynthesis
VKLLLIVGDFPPFLSGIGDYTDRLAGALSRAGVDVTVLTLAGKDDGVERPYRVRREMPDFTMKSMSLAVEIAREFDVVNIQYPGVHFGRSPMMNLLPAVLRRKAPHVKTTATIHDCRVMRWRWRLRTWPMVNAVHGLIHVDPGDWPYIDAWCTFGSPPHACIPIASNVDVLPATPNDRARWRSALGIAPDESAIAYFGILYPHKGVDELLDAHAALRGKGHKLKTVIVGDFDRDDAFVAPMKKRFEPLDVIWVPSASLTRVSECLHACDLAVLPFHSGTSTNRSSMLATIGHGLPTVTTRGPATPKEITDLFDLELVPPKDAVALAAAIERVLTDASLRERLTRNAAVAGNRITWDAVARQHTDFFTSILGTSAVTSSEVACAS